jgi:predicted Rossmann fold flavoprotein
LSEQADIVIVGAGAAGLMAAIWAGRTNPGRTIIVQDGAKTLGAKILVAGGGRCNVTHDEVNVDAYAGSSPNAIRKVLHRFDVPETVEFFHEIGVTLKREETGKLFPTTDSARTVLDALLGAARKSGVQLQYPRRVETITRTPEDKFCIQGTWGEIKTAHLILATGGRSLPKSGSDGHGYAIAQALGHQLTRRIFPALVPLTLPRDHFICSLSGLTLPTTLELRSGTGKRLIAFTDSTLCTHFGLSGPSVLDFSRYYIDAQFTDPGASAFINWLPGTTTEHIEQELQRLGKKSPFRHLDKYLPERLIHALFHEAGVPTNMAGDQLTREARKAVARVCTQLPLPITGNRGYTYAEVTAGGIPLSQIYLERMESRVCPGLHLCGEICDVDGRIGGYNFQWAWTSGYVAGISAG